MGLGWVAPAAFESWVAQLPGSPRTVPSELALVPLHPAQGALPFAYCHLEVPKTPSYLFTDSVRDEGSGCDCLVVSELSGV